MKRISFFTFFILALAIVADAQTFIGGGVTVRRSSSYDPSPLKTGDGGDVAAGGYVEGGYQFPLGFQARFLGEYLSKPTLYSIFTSDAPTGKKAKDEFRFRPELRLRPGCKDARFCLFIGGGADYFRQRFDVTGQAVRGGQPAAGLNPFFTVGAEFGKGVEVGYRRLFTDTSALNSSKLHGHSGDITHTQRLFGRVHLRLAGQFDYLIFRDSVGYYVGNYDKRDFGAKFRGGLVFQ